MNSVKVLLCRTFSLAALVISTPLAAQNGSGAGLRSEVFPGTPAESYLRYLQTDGKVPLAPWGSRPFSRKELDWLLATDSLHPWRERLRDESRAIGPVRYDLISPATTFRYNTGFAYGSNDGPVWAGRGLTSSLQLGLSARWGPVSLTVAPLMFRSENQSYSIIPTGRQGDASFGDPLFGGVDRPQRFGDTPYSQIDPGQSTLRVDLPYVAFGLSTANQTWGPGQELPVILGNNAAGFPHAFVGSSEPIDIWIAKLHGKVMWGQLSQSDFSTVTGPEKYLSRAEPGTKRFTTGFTLSIEPRGMTGLELGATRFFHSIWPRSGIPRSYYTKFLQGILKKDVPFDREPDPRFQAASEDRGIADNQLVSVFARWVLPRSGFELHAEYGRDDHSYDARDLLQEIDHSRVYSLGARKVFRSTPTELTAGRFEIMNFQLPQLVRYRGEGEIYVHGLIRQGHTYKGQLLGADVGVGTGAGSVVAVDRFTGSGRWTASWSRVIRRENGNYLLAGIRTPRSMDVTHALGLETTRLVRGFDVTGGLTMVYNFNRDFIEDATNVNALLGVRYGIP